MCGFTGYVDTKERTQANGEILKAMADTIVHRGPDDEGYFIEREVGIGFRRLSIIDLAGGHQPLFNEDESAVMVCNGEIFNYVELREELQAKGHRFRTNCDIEVIVHLYEEYGDQFVARLNGQFAFVVYDRKRRRFLMARDQFGIIPFFYTMVDGLFIFGSEIKAILAHPQAPRQLDPTGLDQLLSFPGIVSPRTMFAGIQSLKPGELMTLEAGRLAPRTYWDLNYPCDGELSYDKPESYYVERLAHLLETSVRLRLHADVPVGFYLSGGLDSSLIASLGQRLSPDSRRSSFSICFDDQEINEQRYQRMMAERIGTTHHATHFGWSQILETLSDMVWYCECPVKETYNTCSMALSRSAKNDGITVILTGEGADEFFAGYMGYRFDQRSRHRGDGLDLEEILEDDMRAKIWGSADIFFEKQQYQLRAHKQAFYSDALNLSFDAFDFSNHFLVDKQQLAGRHHVHQRSYLDAKLRLADHLLGDHGDRMALANSVEARYPFLDLDLIEFAREIPPHLKIKGFCEKYIVREVAKSFVPDEIRNREKFGFRAPASPYLLQQKVDWVEDLLSYERIKRQGYLNPDAIEFLKKDYRARANEFNPHQETDLLLVALTLGLLLDRFNLPDLA